MIFFYFELDRENLNPSETRLFYVKNPEGMISKIPAIFVFKSKNKSLISGSDGFYTFELRSVPHHQKKLIILINFKNSHNYENDSLVWVQLGIISGNSGFRIITVFSFF